MNQLDQVREAMSNGGWYTLHGLSERLKIAEATLSAHIRSLRKPVNGGYTVLREYLQAYDGKWLHHYRLVVPAKGTTTAKRKVAPQPVAAKVAKPPAARKPRGRKPGKKQTPPVEMDLTKMLLDAIEQILIRPTPPRKTRKT
jgi:hypothetical protein